MPLPGRAQAVVWACLLAALFTASFPGGVLAQSAVFGSIDDPAEARRLPRWDRERHLDLQAGPSLIGAQWRSAARAALRVEGPYESLELEASARAGVYGSYGPDLDEPYDLLRLVSFARLDPSPRRTLYARIGTIRRLRLGPGHLVDHFSGETAWNERFVGAEAWFGRRAWSVYGFTQDVRLGRTLGGRVELHPLAGARSEALSSLVLAGSWVTDRGTFDRPDVAPVRAVQADVRLTAARSGAFTLEPFVSVARFTRYGRGLMFGADLEADNFIDVARLHFRLAVNYGGRRFEPGYFGAFYPVRSQLARTVSSDSSGISDDRSVVGLPLERATGGTDVFSELRLHFFGRVELWYAFRRHYGVYPLSEMHLRLFVRATRLRLALSQDRGGLSGFFSVFEPLGDESALSLRASYRLFPRVWIHSEARYTYERVAVEGATTDRYLVQRWFEPYAGLRLEW